MAQWGLPAKTHSMLNRVHTWSSRFYPLSIVLLLITQQCACSPTTVADCEGMKFGILDLNDLAKAAGVPKCTLSDVHVNIENGIVYTHKVQLNHAVSHNFGTHAAPWFLRGAIQSSKYYTPVLDEADIIFVYDYCHYIHWLGFVHSMSPEEEEPTVGPGDPLVAIYKEMLKMPEWKKSDGGHFVFYDSHPGFFQAGEASPVVADMRCNTFRNATHIITDTPMRNVCEQYWRIKKIMVTPYVPNPLEEKNPRAYLHLPYRPLADRQVLAYCRSTCYPYEYPSTNAGKLMRYWFSYKEWGNIPEMDVRCTDRQLSSEGHLNFQEMFKKMRSAIFCPVFPGDAASTRRLSEIFLAGCIPVFLGPPYHSMPFSETVPYKDLGIFFNITETQHWLIDASPEWQLHPTIRSVHETEARWWVPDTDINEALIHVQSPADILGKLKAIPASVLETKLRLMHEYGTRFTFLQRLTQPPNAVNSLLAGICIKQRQHPAPHTSVNHALASITTP